jgi:hypothetical protein
MLCAAAVLIFFIAGLLYLFASSASITWERIGLAGHPPDSVDSVIFIIRSRPTRIMKRDATNWVGIIAIFTSNPKSLV